ncbi:hypothetical protein V6N12_000939 [Hibiscus sabdariffa]|uniref:Uncharacterized protein n=1 Tax=Hibiscus sabdariffa TaxID=183260 RepID=A0ABR1ZX40_9ROSI
MDRGRALGCFKDLGEEEFNELSCFALIFQWGLNVEGGRLQSFHWCLAPKEKGDGGERWRRRKKKTLRS